MRTHSATTVSKSPLKWAGGKSKLLQQLVPLLPPGRRLIEPFVGAGSVFLGTNYKQYVLNDANADLMAMWTALQCRPREFITRAAELFAEANLCESSYMRIRAEFNGLNDRFERAVRLVYLNKFGFNGVFRVNRRGQFNVPYGRPAKLPTFPFEQMEAAALKLQNCTLMIGGFQAAMAVAGPGDVVYCDPPYSASTSGNSFSSYTSEGFGPREHKLLVDAAGQAADRGAFVLVSNHDTAETRDLYRHWDLARVSVRRSIGANATTRDVANEVVAKLRPTRCWVFAC